MLWTLNTSHYLNVIQFLIYAVLMDDDGSRLLLVDSSKCPTIIWSPQRKVASAKFTNDKKPTGKKDYFRQFSLENFAIFRFFVATSSFFTCGRHFITETDQPAVHPQIFRLSWVRLSSNEHVLYVHHMWNQIVMSYVVCSVQTSKME